MLLLLTSTSSFSEDDNARQGVRSLKAYAAYKAGDYETARNIWQALAEKGNTTAMNNLANMFDQGQGSPEDQQKAAQWLMQGAKAGDSVSQLNLGLAYEKGRGVTRNNYEAAKWFELAALQGDVDAQFNLGVMRLTAYGKGQQAASIEDKQAALIWLQKAAQQYHPEARHFLNLIDQ